jgi:hypothetical protein
MGGRMSFEGGRYERGLVHLLHAATLLLPAGVAGGRWAWRYLATQLGVLPEPAIPLTAIVIAIPAALVVANLIAAAPGQAAARTPPAAVLRTE